MEEEEKREEFPISQTPPETPPETPPAAPSGPGIRIEPKDAVMRAYKYLDSVTPNQKIENVRIEELEPMEEGEFWSVVLSYDVRGDFTFDRKREYKEFKIDATTGDVIYMKIRKV